MLVETDVAAIGYVTFTARDVEAMMTFWADATGYALRPGPFMLLEDPAGRSPTLHFQRADAAPPRPGAVHLDLVATDRRTEVARLIGLGASRVREVSDNGLVWTVMADPEGNEFCVFEDPG